MVHLLSILWKIVLFFRAQRKYRFYSSSLLVAYDARKLRQHCGSNKSADYPTKSRTKSASSVSNSLTSHIGSSETEQTAETLSSADTRKKKKNCTQEQELDVSLPKKSTSSVSATKSRTVDRNLACNPNETPRSRPKRLSLQELLDILKDDKASIDRIVSTSTDKCNWVRLNMIDFTHVFPAETDSSLDLNYLEGIEKLIDLLTIFIQEGTCNGDSEEESSRVNVVQ